MEPPLLPPNNKLATAHLLCSLCFIFFVFLANLGHAKTPKLHPTEVEALKEIAKKLEKTNWNFTEDPCSGKGNWRIHDVRKGFESNVTCDCTVDGNSSCHVISIALKSQNLTGIVPPEFSKLRYLKILDLSKNCLTGSIPSQWATMRLEELSFMGNKLEGLFPKVLTSITTLRNLSIEGNNFTGPIPPEIGKLINLQKLIISSNAFNGKLPTEFSELTNLDDLRINDNNFRGKIPEFIGKWKNIEKLQMVGCSLEGPIPSTISGLKYLNDLRITDLKGEGYKFPDLRSMQSMKTLILRKCSIHGEIPNYIGDMEKLKNLDLSFNNLSGEIPSSFSKLDKADFIYLTSNNLIGTVPTWVLGRNKNVDISYNNFTWDTSSRDECPRGSVNLVESYSPTNKMNKVLPCLKRNFPCNASKKSYRSSLYVNCGGKGAIVGGNKYEADSEQRGASMYYDEGQGWAFSSTGNFMDNDIDSDDYIQSNTSSLINVSDADLGLYTTSRVSPLSLTYYGLCLWNGDYTVKLHFAEIRFSSNDTFNSLGKRIFDVYIQGKLVLKDFNIEDEAGGTEKPIVRTFIANVTSNTLKIRFYWAGRGTTGIPLRGVYGPSISAISAISNFKPPSVEDKHNYVPILVGSGMAALCISIIIFVIMYRKCWLGDKAVVDKELRSLDLQTGLFTLRQMKAATKNFDHANKIGEGGFGSVYKGLLSDGTIIAVKQLSTKSKQGNREFVNEIGMISGLQHPNLVKLYGCSVEGNQLLLVYEYMENNCISRALFGRDASCRMKLDWPIRRKICLGIAKGLAYLHEESRLKIVHRDIKTSNVLLDKDFNAKISDFGLAKLFEDEHTHISTKIAGTIGYMAPEYAMRGCLTVKADVYSFGIVALEIVSGKSNTNYRPEEEFEYLLDWAYVMQERGSMLELIDPDLGSEYSSEEAMLMLNVALLCTNASPTLRPTMTQVVSMLEGKTAVQDLLSDVGFSALSTRYRTIRKHFWQNVPSQTQSMTEDGPCTDSTSIEDSAHAL